ncbi:MAG: hypothetical protein P8H88_00990, partial [Flavobacteriales bacterium]|nr:hypothetical protein [Flavobacteriales bacterium]
MNTSLMLRAGLLLGAVRTLWVAVEHLVGARSTQLEWVEPSYGLFLFVGAPLTWFFLLRDHNKSAQPQGVKEILTAGLGAGLLSGLIHVGVFALYTEILNPDYLDAFISWNAENSSNTSEINGEVCTHGGRVLCVTALGDNVSDAQAQA